MAKSEWEFTLDDQSIESCVDKIYECSVKYLPDIHRDGRGMKVIQQVLKNNQQYFGPEKSAIASVIYRLGRLNIYIKVKGETFDPRLSAQNEESQYLEELLAKYNVEAPSYRYSRGTNIFHAMIKPEKKLGSIARMGIGLAAGIALGLLGLLFSEELRVQLALILSTFNGIILDLIVMSATLVVFLMVANSIAGFGSADALKNSGTIVIKEYAKKYALAIVLLILYIIFAFTFTMSLGGGLGDSLVSIITETIAGIFPKSFVTPFAECSFLQIIFIAVIVGLALLILGEKVRPVTDALVTIETLASQIMDWFCELLPLFIFTMVPGMIWDNLLESMAGAFIHLVGIILVAVLIFAIVLLITSKKTGMSPGKVFKLVSPALLQGFMTCSSTASLPKIQESLKAFKVKSSFNDLASALGFILEGSPSFVCLFILTFYLMTESGTVISPSIIISMIISCLLMSIASPPVSGGGVAIALILAEMFGVQDEYLTVVTPIMVLFDFFGTALRCGNIVLTGVISAEKLGEVEEDAE